MRIFFINSNYSKLSHSFCNKFDVNINKFTWLLLLIRPSINHFLTPRSPFLDLESTSIDGKTNNKALHPSMHQLLNSLAFSSSKVISVQVLIHEHRLVNASNQNQQLQRHSNPKQHAFHTSRNVNLVLWHNPIKKSHKVRYYNPKSRGPSQPIQNLDKQNCNKRRSI